MTRLAKLTTTALLAVALAPAAAQADELRGAPQMRVLDAKTVTVTFATDERIDAENPRVVVLDRGTAIAKAIKADGRHGRDFKYTARVTVRKPLTVGRKYKVRFAVFGEETVERLVVLKAKKA